MTNSRVTFVFVFIGFQKCVQNSCKQKFIKGGNWKKVWRKLVPPVGVDDLGSMGSVELSSV